MIAASVPVAGRAEEGKPDPEQDRHRSDDPEDKAVGMERRSAMGTLERRLQCLVGAPKRPGNG